MKTMIKLSFVLAAYAVVACVSLALVYNATAPAIAAAAEGEVTGGLKELFPDADGFENVTDRISSGELASGNKTIAFEKAYVVKSGGSVAGMVIQVTGPTYKSSTLLVGVDTGRKIRAVKFMENSDTPGLGTKTAEPAFAGQFPGKSIDDAFSVGDDLAAVSGATISSKGVAKILKLASYQAGEFLAANYGAAAGSGPAPEAAEYAPVSLSDALSALFPGCALSDISAEVANTLERSVVFDSAWLAKKDGDVAGIAVQARGQTYHASTVLVGVKPDRTLAGLRVNDTTDSKNYGYSMVEPAFYEKYAGKRVDDAFLVQPATPDGDLDSISGATISSMGVANMAKVAALEGARVLAERYGGRKGPASPGSIVLNVIPEEE